MLSMRMLCTLKTELSWEPGSKMQVSNTDLAMLSMYGKYINLKLEGDGGIRENHHKSLSSSRVNSLPSWVPRSALF